MSPRVKCQRGYSGCPLFPSSAAREESDSRERHEGNRRGFGDGAGRGLARETDKRKTCGDEWGALNSDVEVDDPVIVDVDFSVVVEIPVEPAGCSQGRVEIDPAVVIHVDLPVQVCVAAIGVHDQRVAAGDGLAGPGGGFGGGDAFDLRSRRDAKGREIASGGAGDDAASVPRAAVAAGLDETCQSSVTRAAPGADRTG